MALADLFFLAALLAFVLGASWASYAVLRGRWAIARRPALIVAGAAAIYVAVGLVVSYATPQRVIPLGAPWCFDDWCLSLDRVTVRPAGADHAFIAEVRIISRARRVSQRAAGAWIYLIDAGGRRYAPESDPGDVPLDVLLEPGEMRAATRRFLLPAGIRPAGLITGHGGPYCGPMDILIIGQAGCLFGKPTMIQTSGE
jgi:hypothetical protein